MFTLQIEHPVSNYEAWKKIFDSDPAGRQKNGVIRYTIYRSMDDPNLVIGELVFEEKDKAERFLQALRGIWGNMAGNVIGNPKGRILEEVESKNYQ